LFKTLITQSALKELLLVTSQGST